MCNNPSADDSWVAPEKLVSIMYAHDRHYIQISLLRMCILVQNVQYIQLLAAKLHTSYHVWLFVRSMRRLAPHINPILRSWRVFACWKGATAIGRPWSGPHASQSLLATISVGAITGLRMRWKYHHFYWAGCRRRNGCNEPRLIT